MAGSNAEKMHFTCVKCIFALWKDTVFTLTRYSVCGKMTRKGGVMMKHIETVLSEQRFLNRLEGLCRDKVRFDRGYEDKDTFVIKRKDHKFMLAKHYASIGRRHGYANDCLYCRYYTNEKGYVSIDYRFWKMKGYLIPFIVSLILGSGLWIYWIYEAIASSNVQWDAMCVAALIWILGLGGMLVRSKKERIALEKHLYRICQWKDAD